MKHWFTPKSFHQLALIVSPYRWRLLAWSALVFALYLLLETQITQTTPNTLVWLSLFILFASLQILVFASFIFFFKKLPSTLVKDTAWRKLYQVVEWCEAMLFALLLPLPSLVFLYALCMVSGFSLF